MYFQLTPNLLASSLSDLFDVYRKDFSLLDSNGEWREPNKENVYVHVNYVKNTLANMLNYNRFYLEGYVEPIEKFQKVIKKELTSQRDASNIKIPFQAVKELTESICSIKINLEENNNAFSILKMFRNSGFFNSFDYKEYLSFMDKDLVDNLVFTGVEQCRKIISENTPDKKDALDVLKRTDTHTCQFIKLWMSGVIKNDVKIEINELVDFVYSFETFRESNCTLNGLKAISVFLFDFVKQNGAKKEDYHLVYTYSENKIVALDKLKALDNLEKLKIKHNVQIEVKEDVEAYEDLLNNVNLTKRYFWNKRALNSLFKLSETQMVSLEFKLTKICCESFMTIFRNEDWKGFEFFEEGSNAKGFYSFCVNLDDGDPEKQKRLDFINLMITRFLKEIVHNDHEVVMSWDLNKIVAVYDDYNKEVFMNTLSKTMNAPNELEEPKQETAFKL